MPNLGSRAGLRASAVLVISLIVGACGGGAGGLPQVTVGATTSAGATEAPTPSTTTGATSPIAQPTTDGTSLPPVGGPADDGARVVDVQDFDARTKDLRIDSPAVGVVTVRLLLPAGFEDQPTTRWPSLYLVHGSGGSYLDWTGLTDVEELTASSGVLVVMPDGGDHGWYADWWNGGVGGPPMWETFHTVELPQLLERNWHASERRAIAGLSMGGHGAIVYAARHPKLYLAAASYSGVMDPIGGAMEANDWWGDPVAQADVWQAHDPVNIASGLAGLPLYVSYGDGTPGPFDGATISGDDPEAWLALQNATFVQRLGELDIPVTVDAYGPGSHDWPYWERALHRSFPMLLKALLP